jgi:hypothetical protein
MKLKEPTYAFAVVSGNLTRAVTATDHFEAAKKAAIAHAKDKTEDPIEPGQIFSVYREGDVSEDTTYFDTAYVMKGAGFLFHYDD